MTYRRRGEVLHAARGDEDEDQVGGQPAGEHRDDGAEAEPDRDEDGKDAGRHRRDDETEHAGAAAVEEIDKFEASFDLGQGATAGIRLRLADPAAKAGAAGVRGQRPVIGTLIRTALHPICRAVMFTLRPPVIHRFFTCAMPFPCAKVCASPQAL